MEKDILFTKLPFYRANTYFSPNIRLTPNIGRKRGKAYPKSLKYE